MVTIHIRRQRLVLKLYITLIIIHFSLNYLISGVSSARILNVIGGGDWSVNRLLPDAVRAFSNNETLQIRNRYAIRPWQHVIEPIIGYLKLIEKMSFDETFSRSWNFGPSADFNVNVDHIVNIFREY